MCRRTHHCRYSGYLKVEGPLGKAKYDSMMIHYELHTSQRSPDSDPLVTWHQVRCALL